MLQVHIRLITDLVYVISGIEPTNEKKAIDIIAEQLDDNAKRRNITDLELDSNKGDA